MAQDLTVRPEEPEGKSKSTSVNKTQRKLAILEWRDRWELAVDDFLKPHQNRLMLEIKQILESKSFIDSLFRSRRILRDDVEPVIQTWVANTSTDFIEKASREALSVLRQHGGPIQVSNSIESLAENRQAYKDIADLAATIGPAAAAIVAIPTAVSGSIVSAGGLLGLLGVTVIAWPFAIASGVVITFTLMTAAFRASSFKQRALNRLFKKISAYVDELTFGRIEIASPTTQESGGLCGNLQRIIRETAEAQLHTEDTE
ncbi:MAG: hypothetical protein RQ826_09550 [Xanthomonadales bacterium]|nr:hypothetical protein [Xanthomonadales bacterium]